MAPDPEISLREFMELKFKNLGEKFEGLENRQGALEKKFEALERVVSNDILHMLKIWKWIGGLVVAIVVALAIAWLRQMLGL